MPGSPPGVGGAPADRRVYLRLSADAPRTRSEWNVVMRAVLVRLTHGASRHPLVLFVAVAAAGAGLARLAWAGEVELAGAGFSVLS